MQLFPNSHGFYAQLVQVIHGQREEFLNVHGCKKMGKNAVDAESSMASDHLLHVRLIESTSRDEISADCVFITKLRTEPIGQGPIWVHL